MRMTMRMTCVVVVLVLLLSFSMLSWMDSTVAAAIVTSSSAATTMTMTTTKMGPSPTARINDVESLLSLHTLASLNGGAVRKSKANTRTKSTTNMATPAAKMAAKSGPRKLLDSVQDSLKQIKPVTRYYLLLSFFCTLVHALGLPAPAMFAHDLSHPFQLWRWITSVAYFGPPSLVVANHLYFLVRYGQSVEGTNGKAEFAWFLLVQTLLLGVLGLILGFPLLAQSLTTAIVYASCRLNPMETIPFQFGLLLKSWQIPYASLVIDCLAQQNVAAAWPHILGIFTAHLYEFCTVIWPRLGGKAMLTAPAWFVQRMGGPKKSNIEGFDFRNKPGTSTATRTGTGNVEMNQRQRNKKKKFATLFTSK